MKYRSRSDIAAAILKIAADGAIKTKIMYRAYLSFPQLQEYLDVLQRSRLLDYDEATRLFRTTAKGTNFVRLHDELSSMLVMTNKPVTAAVRARQ